MTDHIHLQHYKKTGFWGRRAAGCLFFSRTTQRLCFALRSRHALQPLTYGTWGGAMDGDETPLEAVMREVEEEAGHLVDRERVHAAFVFRHENLFEYHNFLVEVDEEFEPVLNWENADFVWANLWDWPDPLHPGVVTLLGDEATRALISRLADS